MEISFPHDVNIQQFKITVQFSTKKSLKSKTGYSVLSLLILKPMRITSVTKDLRKHLGRVSQNVCAVTYVKVKQNSPKLRPTKNVRDVNTGHEIPFSISESTYMAYIALRVSRFSSKKPSSIVRNLNNLLEISNISSEN